MKDSMDKISIPAATSFRGEVVLPGSKSIANRSLFLASLSAGDTLLHNLPDSDDVKILLQALPSLGVEIRRMKKSEDAPVHLRTKSGPVAVKGVGGAFPVKSANVYLENAGTAIRPMTAILAASQGEYIIDGNEQMRRRPIGDLVLALRELGIQIEASPTGCPPIRMKTAGIPGGVTRISGKVSSQYLSALLMAGPLATGGDLTVEMLDDPVSKPYIDITLKMMESFGARVTREEYRRFVVQQGNYTSPGEYRIEGDASAATYFLAAGSLPGNGPVTVYGLDENSIQGDLKFVELLKSMGAHIESVPGGIRAQGSSNLKKLHALDVDMNAMPDAAMTLAVMALFADGETRIRNIANLRVKESERIAGLRSQLEKLGASVKEFSDALFITPPEKLNFSTIETFKDHRMAMAFSLAVFGTDLEIEDPACVSKTYPDFFEDFLPLLVR